MDNTVYDVDYYGYSVEAAYFEDYTSSLYKNALNYAEIYDKTVYSCPIHKFKSYDKMKKFFEPYGDLKLSGISDSVKKLLDEIMKDVGHLYGVLHTESARELYETYGFKVTATSATGEYTMEKQRR